MDVLRLLQLISDQFINQVNHKIQLKILELLFVSDIELDHVHCLV